MVFLNNNPTVCEFNVLNLISNRDKLDPKPEAVGAGLELTVGNIYLPQAQKHSKAIGAPENPLQSYVLSQGEIVVIFTKETLKIPKNIAGICFPPTRHAAEGLLMHNPGLIDPGFEGPLHFTLTNMGKNEYLIKKNDKIANAIFFENEGISQVDDLKITNNKPDIKDLLLLTNDFMGFEKRATAIVEKGVRKSELNARWISLLAALFAVIFPFFLSYFQPFGELISKKDFTELQKKVQILECSNSKQGVTGTNLLNTDFNKEIDVIKKSLNDLITFKRNFFWIGLGAIVFFLFYSGFLYYLFKRYKKMKKYM